MFPTLNTDLDLTLTYTFGIGTFARKIKYQHLAIVSRSHARALAVRFMITFEILTKNMINEYIMIICYNEYQFVQVSFHRSK